MPNPSVAHLLISTAAIGGITVLWLEFTAKSAKKVMQLANEMLADKGAEERKKEREIQEGLGRRLPEIIIRDEQLRIKLSEKMEEELPEIIRTRDEQLIRKLSEIIGEEEEEAAGESD